MSDTFIKITYFKNKVSWTTTLFVKYYLTINLYYKVLWPVTGSTNRYTLFVIYYISEVIFMNTNKSLVVFQDKKIRRTWHNNEWWFFSS
jgi:hypothetical protein